MNKQELKEAILALKKEKKALILAHYYQDADIQELADYVGDSLGLSIEAAKSKADIIVFAGVYFMAETAKVLNPKSKVLVPDVEAGCSLADGCPPEAFRAFRNQYPEHVAVTYVNCSAEVKALSDLVCTSSNALKVINSIPADKPILFAPDKNLGRYLQSQTQRELVLWDGACVVHEAFSMEKLTHLIAQHPNAKLAAHPESEMHLLKLADYIGSTAGIIQYVKATDVQEFIIATEAGILHEIMKQAPGKTLIPAPSREDNTCACSECAFMKVNTLKKLYDCLLNESPEVMVEEGIRQRALLPIERMLEISA
ncbi:quinolinate synthase NadA [Cytophagales bacterium LB-30]|uniref:Quinolinate synthase n=1 Tax=Shiella aurantiaca TaxID=3058365 RepID=A0ABT8F4U6_9BACT|nr:quinolinate synthase NadA [Shiella aurantiaca]MDN4165006.1 quinolinate synthase NadA [Shiella aurantiaca]